MSAYVDDLLTLQEEAWTKRFHSAADKIEALYAEFTPELHGHARSLGKMLGAGGMAFVEVRYGDDESSAQLYGGTYESDVLSTQHNAGHSWNFMRNMFRYATYINNRDDSDEPPYGPDFFMRVPHIAAYHDSIMGNGRGHDERQAALFAGRLMMDFGISPTPDEPTMAAIEATTWDDKNRRQLIYSGEDWPAYRAAARVADLLTSTDPYGAYESFRVILEDMTKVRYNRLLTLVARQRGFDLQAASMEERMDFIDNSAVKHLFGDMLNGQAQFIRNLPLADPTIKADFSGYQANADILQFVADEYRGGSLSAVGSLEVIQRYGLSAA